MMEQHSIWLLISPEHQILNIHVDLICNMHLMRCNISWTVCINNVGEVFHDMFFFFQDIDFLLTVNFINIYVISVYFIESLHKMLILWNYNIFLPLIGLNNLYVKFFSQFCNNTVNLTFFSEIINVSLLSWWFWNCKN